MISEIDVRIDTAELRHIDGPVTISATVTLPAAASLAARPIIFFALAGGGYSRGYFTDCLPGPGSAAQARWHAERGSIFVALDILGTDGSLGDAAESLSLAAVVEAHDRAVSHILLRLANGTLQPGFPSIIDPLRIGVGHSLGACITIVQQAQYRSFDGIAVLGYSPYLNKLQAAPGHVDIVVPWISRDVSPHLPGGILNEALLQEANDAQENRSGWAAYAWTCYYDDVPEYVIEQDLAHFEKLGISRTASERRLDHPWASPFPPGKFGAMTLSPGIIAAEAAAITVPVLSAMGERDTVADPRGEARCYLSSSSFQLFVCSRMGHVHNFAGTRAQLWRRLELFAPVCAERY